MKNKVWMSGLAIALGVGLIGCTPEAREKYDAAGDRAGQAANQAGDAAKTDASQTGRALEDAGEKAGEAAKETGEAALGAASAAGEAVGGAAKNAERAAERAGKEIGQKADNAQTTLAIKNAILTAKGIDASDLNVDTEGKTVFLRGTVRTGKEKQRSEAIAKNIVGTAYNVRNELKVR